MISRVGCAEDAAFGLHRLRNSVAVCNSDQVVMRLAVGWMRRLMEKKLDFSIQYHADQDLEELRAYWAETLATDGSAIRLQRKSNSNQMTGRVWRSRYGS